MQPTWILSYTYRRVSDLPPLLFLYKQMLLHWNLALKTPHIKQHLKHPMMFFALSLIAPDFAIILKF